jgi:excisionase family DNA binding protein
MDKTSISVPEMREMLGMKKVESYWLVKQGHFKVILVGGKMRIMLDSFEDWYNRQFHYKKVNGPEPGQHWPPSWTVPEIADILRLTTSSVYDLMKKEQPFQTFTVNGQMRIRKDHFEEWYQSQSHYKKREDAPQELLDATLSVGDVAKMLGIHRNSVYSMINRRHLFDAVVIDRKIRIYKDSFTKWLDSQDKHSIIIGKEDE